MKLTAKEWNVIYDYAEMLNLKPQKFNSANQYEFTHRETGVVVKVGLQTMKKAVEKSKKEDKEQ